MLASIEAKEHRRHVYRAVKRLVEDIYRFHSPITHPKWYPYQETLPVEVGLTAFDKPKRSDDGIVYIARLKIPGERKQRFLCTINLAGRYWAVITTKAEMTKIVKLHDRTVVI